MNRCSFCYKETNQLIEMGNKKKKYLCWYCIDIIQKWETFRWENEKKEAEETN